MTHSSTVPITSGQVSQDVEIQQDGRRDTGDEIPIAAPTFQSHCVTFAHIETGVNMYRIIQNRSVDVGIGRGHPESTQNVESARWPYEQIQHEWEWPTCIIRIGILMHDMPEDRSVTSL